MGGINLKISPITVVPTGGFDVAASCDIEKTFAGIFSEKAVTPSVKESVAGWVDNLNAPIELLVGGGKGVIRGMHY